MNQPSVIALSFTRFGSDSRVSLVSTTSPPTGMYTSEAALTDSTEPKDSLDRRDTQEGCELWEKTGTSGWCAAGAQGW